MRATGTFDGNYMDPDGVYRGRSTNGRNWVDYLNETLSPTYQLEIHNYAYGGAAACSANPAGAPASPIKDLAGQTADFLADVEAGRIRAGPDTRVLVLQWIGHNDFRLGLQGILSGGRIPGEAEAMQLVQTVVQCRLDNLRELAALGGGGGGGGGVVTDIAVMPLIPLHMLPQVPAFLKPQAQQLDTLVDTATAAAVRALQGSLDQLPRGSPGAGVEVHLLGSTGAWITRGEGKVQPPFTHLDESCLPVAPSSMQDCSDPDDYAFFDGVHPSSRFHRWLALQGILPRLQNLRLLPRQ